MSLNGFRDLEDTHNHPQLWGPPLYCPCAHARKITRFFRPAVSFSQVWKLQGNGPHDGVKVGAEYGDRVNFVVVVDDGDSAKKH